MTGPRTPGGVTGPEVPPRAAGRLPGALADLLMGARMAVTGGRDGWTRAVLTALGVGVGVAMLLLAAAVPGALDARAARGDARADVGNGPELTSAANTLLVAPVDTVFRERPVRGRILRAEGPAAPLPPGVPRLPAAGEVVVSPALRELLDSPDGPLFAPRLGGARVTGTIAAQGLTGPHELAFYLGSNALTADRAQRIDHFGGGPPSEEFSPVLMVLVVVVFVVLLLPIVVFVGAAVRFGGDRRDRRLAALRLLGADAGMIRRISAGEAAAGAVLGLAVGGALFAAGRQLAPLLTLQNVSVSASDLRPSLPLVAAVGVAVPVLAVLVALVAQRRVVVEPLGVSRQGTTVRRRLWWRLLLPAAGLALLYPLTGVGERTAGSDDYQVAAGAVLVLIGTVTLLPWLIDLVVGRLRGGPVPWQLAVRRLQLDSATSARLVNGVAVAVAGSIGLQMLVAGVEDRFATRTGQDTSRAQAYVWFADLPDPGAALARLAAAPGVTRSAGTLATVATGEQQPGTDAPPFTEVRIGDCAALAEFARLGSCADGDVFLAEGPAGKRSGPAGTGPVPGTRMTVGANEIPWTVPARTRTVPAMPDPVGWVRGGLLVTPGAAGASRWTGLSAEALISVDPGDPDALERVRNAAAEVDLRAQVSALTDVTWSTQFVNVKRGLAVGVVVTLLLLGTSMLVGVLEQLRERRRLLAMLVAVGTPRRALGWSVFWQAAVPVLVGLGLAVGFGLGLGAVLLRMVGAPVTVSWPVVALGAGLGGGVVLLVTGASLPVLWRLTRPDGLRAE
ncbi:FtsX-like permease family protein [Micromonospora sp. MW-13]|uniref:ABC transporter permease n=1 Tax=Micromonospora sp. MW-13 TaxID=2094022 RepID=UPI000EE29221|nr:ABC transporter permease [Micromonospora sp. MW-13]RGC68273.1 FtsX-like permease family protein [Micromonospora sp. MW-13]